jgi:hypothetical protein
MRYYIVSSCHRVFIIVPSRFHHRTIAFTNVSSRFHHRTVVPSGFHLRLTDSAFQQYHEHINHVRDNIKTYTIINVTTLADQNT